MKKIKFYLQSANIWESGLLPTLNIYEQNQLLPVQRGSSRSFFTPEMYFCNKYKNCQINWKSSEKMSVKFTHPAFYALPFYVVEKETSPTFPLLGRLNKNDNNDYVDEEW